MSEQDINLTAEEQEIAEVEAQALLDGTSSSETDQSDESEASEDNSEEVEEQPESKADKNFKKILSQKNEAKKEADELKNRVMWLEKEIRDKDFYNDFPDAIEHREEIDKLMEERGFSQKEAFVQIQWDAILSGQHSSKRFWLQWRTPSWVGEKKKPEDMSADELVAAATEMQNSWTLEF